LTRATSPNVVPTGACTDALLTLSSEQSGKYQRQKLNAFVQIYNYIWQISVSLPIKVQLMFRANICLVENRKQSILAATYKSSLRLE
jgi:hypothetical protein